MTRSSFVYGNLSKVQVDDYTINAEWARKHNLDRRIDKNEANERYAKVNQEGIGRFRKNETTYQAQRRIGHNVENRIAQLIQEKTGKSIQPSDLPIVGDKEIKKRIRQYS